MRALSRLLKVPLNQDGFFLEAHVKLRPVDFAVEGIFLCGLAHSPRSIDETLAQAHAASVKVAALLCQEGTGGDPDHRRRQSEAVLGVWHLRPGLSLRRTAS